MYTDSQQYKIPLLSVTLFLILSVMFWIHYKGLVNTFNGMVGHIHTKRDIGMVYGNMDNIQSVGNGTFSIGQLARRDNVTSSMDRRSIQSQQNGGNFSGAETTAGMGGLMKRLPQAYIIGVAKCGTGALRRFLASHPNIVVPETPEMYFYDVHYKKGSSWHLSQMPTSSPDQLTLETSPFYFDNPKAMKRIIKDNPKGLFLVILRDPVDRAISHYLDISKNPSIKENGLALGFEKESMKDGRVNRLWPPIYHGIYYKPLKSWLNLVQRERLYVIDGNAFAKNPLPQLKAIEKFLGIPNFFTESRIVFVESKGFYCLKGKDGVPVCLHQSKGRVHPVIKKSVLDELEAFYKPLNEKVFAVLGKRFDWK